MGVVYLGRDLRLDMDVAIKFRGVTHSDATLWLKREFRAVASLRHPNLVELYELVAHDRSCYFTMEYLPGMDPRRWVERRPIPATPVHALDTGLAHGPGMSEQPTRSAPPLQEAHTEITATPPLGSLGAPAARRVVSIDFAKVRSVLSQLAEGLAFLHARGVIHRDVKPSNAIVVDGQVKLLDFGLALERHRQTEDLARESRIVGTAAYLAPEYLERLVVSPHMDVYALGVLAFELCTGAPPFGGTLHVLSRLRRSLRIPRASEANGEVPADLDDLIVRMLSAEPEDRPSALDVAITLSGNLSQPRTLRRELTFVGRQTELARIAARIADPSPRGRLILVTGPSGVGKTTLIDEAIGHARGPELLTWRGRCHERERVPYRAFDLIIDDLATELAGDPRHAKEIEHAAALARVFPVLAPLIDPVLGDEPPAADLRVERERALLALVQMVRTLMTGRRGVVVIDDLQWADDDSLELIALLVERLERPLTFIASWTTVGEAPAQRALLDKLGVAAEVIDVPPMVEADLERLIAELAPLAPTARLATAARLAAGSPYLAEMIGRELGEAGVAEPHEAELRRLDRLNEQERAVSEIAALAGGTTSFEQLRALTGLPSGRLQSVLRGLEDARIVRASPAITGDPVYVFYHQRLREIAHAAMTEPARRALHERFAGWFETTPADPVQLAYHWQHAGNPVRAAHWAIVAADAAQAQLAWGLAADWYARAIELGTDTLAIRAQLAQCLFLGGKLASAANEFLRLARAETNGDRWRVRAAEAYLKLGELDRGLGVLDAVLQRRGERRTTVRALSVVRAATVAARWLSPLPVKPQPVDEVLSSAYRVIASFLSTPYPIESLEYVLRGISLAERRGDRAAHAMGMAMLAAYVATGSLGRFGDRSLANAQRLTELCGVPYPRMVTAGATGMLATLRGNWNGMRTAHQEAEAVCKRLGLERSWEASFLRTYWALGELYAGEAPHALELLAGLTDTSEDLWTRAMLGSCRGRVLVLAGELDQARAVDRELERTPAARQGMSSIYRQVFLGELALAERSWHRARAVGDELARSARTQWLSAMPAISAMVDVITGTADLGIAAAEGDRAAAARARTTARRLFRRGRSSFYAATALRIWAQAEDLLGDRTASRAVLARASVVAAERGGKVDRLAISALSGERIAAGPLGAAVSWSTGGVITQP